MDSYQKTITRISFLFVIYAIIAGGIEKNQLSKQFQKFMNNNNYMKNIMGLLLIFMFIMLEGGWDFDINEQNKAYVNWSSGNCLHTMGYSIFLYIVFILSCKMRLVYNLTFLSMLFLLYVISSQRKYWDIRNTVSKDIINIMYKIEKILIIIIPIIFVYGIYDYYLYQKNQYSNKFNLSKFFLL